VRTMKYAVANLKMNLVSGEEADHYLEVLASEWRQAETKRKAELVICPPFPYMERFRKRLPQGVSLGAQDVFWEERGSFTGEVSPLMLKEFGVRYVIVGHSERRVYFQETNEVVNQKLMRLLRSDMQPILCIGETAEERADDSILQIIRQQLEQGLEGVTALQAKKVIIAYEPRWAIGSDKVPTAHEVMEMRVLIKKILTEKYGVAIADEMAMLYGGSVKVRLLDQVCDEPGMDGVLVGRESLIPQEMVKMATA
jgi:triosephosphate isomerase